MAKRKTSGGARRKSAARGAGRSASTRKGGSRTSSARGKKTGSRTNRASKSRARKPARSTAKASSSRRSAAATRSRKKTARKTAASRTGARRAARKTTRKATRKAAAPRRRATNPAAVTRRTVPVARKRPDLSRPRRTIEDDDLVPTPPSSLDLDRSASASRSGRRELRERFDEHTETGPAVTGGDIDADWESAYSVGDEAPGGDNPTPDQDIVDDIGRAVGVEYQDTEELKGDEKIARRDRHRWELDPASSEDYEER